MIADFENKKESMRPNGSDVNLAVPEIYVLGKSYKRTGSGVVPTALADAQMQLKKTDA